MGDEEAQSPLWLGLDLSTQSLTVVLLGQQKGAAPVYHDCVEYSVCLPQYNTSHGMHIGRSGSGGSGEEQQQNAVVTSPVSMWVEALDMALTRLKLSEAGKGLGRVKAVSVSGQQHGTVYWRTGASQRLAGLAKGADRDTLLELLGDSFARRDCPIWADSSTTAECQALEDALGGAQAVAEATGSAAYCRFSGNQIAKIARESETWTACERVSLVSSFVTSLLLGEYAPIDSSDAGGMNLMDIRTKDWHEGALGATGAAGLREKLGPIVDAHSVLGELSGFFCTKYGLPTSCQVVAGSGDNPNGMAGLGITREDGGDVVAVSLGTSDTVMGVTDEAQPQAEGHVMVSALDPASRFAMLVYKNGSLVRERTRDEHCRRDWSRFETALQSTTPGNGGRLGLYLDMPEITPQTERTGHYRRHNGRQCGPFRPAEEVRAVVEGRFLSMRGRLLRMGIARPTRVLATGGASNNRAMMQVLADVFGAPVYTASVSDAAAVGAALRAKHGYMSAGGFVPFANVVGSFEERGLKVAAEPQAPEGTYDKLVQQYLELEAQVKAGAAGGGDGGGGAAPMDVEGADAGDSGDGIPLKRRLSKAEVGVAGAEGGAGAGLSYKDAGVDIDAGEELVSRIKPACRSTRRPGVEPDLGGFGSVFDLAAAGYGGDDTILVGTVNGVGTKLKIAQAVGAHEGIGVDLVAMCCNELVCQGAEPLFMLDYYATGALSVPEAAGIVEGVAEGCRQANCGLVGGETAEMPSMYKSGEYDLAGFVVGAVRKGDVLPKGVHAGDHLLGLRSSGVHANGFSLVRKIVEIEGLTWTDRAPFDETRTLAEALLTPTRIYVKPVLELIRQRLVHAAAHVSKGGVLEHLTRVLPQDMTAAINVDSAGWVLPPVFEWVREAGMLDRKELLSVFNCGVGMILVVHPDKLSKVQAVLTGLGEEALMLGRVEKRPSKFCSQVMVYGHLESELPRAPGADGAEAHWQTTHNHGSITYSAAGVNANNARLLIEKKIKPACKSTDRPGCDFSTPGRGSGLFDLAAAGYPGGDTLVLGATDGVGTKLKVAQMVGDHSGVGQDLVAMCVNDLIVQGGEPLFFLDYYATGELTTEEVAAVVDSIAEGCRQANCGLVDGDLAEMPSMYPAGEYDLAGFAVGAVHRTRLLPSGVSAGDVLLGISSSGVHSNGFSLVRRVVELADASYEDPAPFDPSQTLGKALLTPTKIYVRAILPLLRAGLLHALAHITGGGITENLPRVLPPHLVAQVDAATWKLPPVFAWLQKAGGLSQAELMRTFNCGIGMILVAPPASVAQVLSLLKEAGETAVYKLGQLRPRQAADGHPVQYTGDLA